MFIRDLKYVPLINWVDTTFYCDRIFNKKDIRVNNWKSKFGVVEWS